MEQLIHTFQDWRFAATVILLGAWAGHWLFLRTPPPSGAADHFRTLLQAGAAGLAARQAGAKPFEFMAQVVGAQSAAALGSDLRRQRRRYLAVGLASATLALLPIFLWLSPTPFVPDWLFGVFAFIGGVRVWQSW